MYIYIYIYIYILFGLRRFVTSAECSTYGANIGCLKKRRLYTTSVSCYLESLGIIFVLRSKNNKYTCQKQYTKKSIK